MPIAVIARLEDQTAQMEIERFAAALPDSHSGRTPFHIRLATYSEDTDVAALGQAVVRIIRSWSQLPISLVGFGIFPGTPSDVWFVPVPIDRLLQLHTKVDARLFKAIGQHCHEHEIWFPSVRLGQTIHDSNSVEVLVRLYEGPIDVMVDRIELIRTEPFEIIISRPLRA